MFTEKCLKNANINEVLTKKYLKEAVKTKSNKQIAEENDCSPSVVRKYLRLYEIQCFNSRKGRIPGNFINGDWLRNGRYYIWDDERHKRVRRYVYVMEKHIGRKIDSKLEVVHHLNGNPIDDRIENLVLMKKRQHDRFHLIVRNKHKKLDDAWTVSKVIDYLYAIPTKKMKRYAELTRIIEL